MENDELDTDDAPYAHAAYFGAVLFYLSGLMMRALSLRYTARTTLSIGYGFAADLFERVLKQSQRWHGRQHSGELRTIVLQDAQDLMNLVSIPMGRMLAQGRW